MKRLKKNAIALNNINKFIDNWASDWQYVDQQLIEQIKRENPDCVYSGEVYRFLEIDLEQCFENYFLDHQEVGYVPGNIAEDLIRKEIRNDDKYYSSSKQLEGISRVVQSLSYDDGVVISFNAENGLDFKALIEKYKDDIIHYDDFLLNYIREAEIITKVSTDYMIDSLRIQDEFDDFGKGLSLYDIPFDWFYEWEGMDKELKIGKKNRK